MVGMQHLVCAEGAECSPRLQVAYMGVMWLWMVWGGAREGHGRVSVPPTLVLVMVSVFLGQRSCITQDDCGIPTGSELQLRARLCRRASTRRCSTLEQLGGAGDSHLGWAGAHDVLSVLLINHTNNTFAGPVFVCC